MIRLLRGSTLGLRSLSASAARLQTLPLTPEMKSQKTWSAASGQANSSITMKVVDMTRNIEDSTKESLNIDRKFVKPIHHNAQYDPFDFTQDKIEREILSRRTDRNPERAYNGKTDVFEELGIDPLDLYMMPNVLNRFLSVTGQILGREQTGCTARNQKKLAIAIERARAAGIISPLRKRGPKRIM